MAIIGGGPAGLMAAEAFMNEAREPVHLFDAMPSLGRKFLMAGKSGLNLTHAEPFDLFLSRFAARRHGLEPALRAFGPEALRAWAHGLGIETFTGSSGRVFPHGFKAAPLLRAWLRRLRADGLVTHVHHRWRGWTADGALLFETPEGPLRIEAEAAVLALGGASWPGLGSDAAWTSWLEAHGVRIKPFRPANCGFDIAWSAHFSGRFAGAPVKPVTLAFGGAHQRGEFVITRTGIEGSAVYALAAALRDAIESTGEAVLTLDLVPDRSPERLEQELARPRGSRSMATHLRRAGIEGVKAGLLRECLPAAAFASPAHLAAGIKALPLRLVAPRPIAEAISSAGGVPFEELDENLMLRALPGIFCAGEMLDWEAPTGGYLLTASIALGRRAGQGAANWLKTR